MAETNQYVATTKRVWVPKLGFFAHFQDRQAMKVGRSTRDFKLAGSYPAVTLPIDWTKNNTLAFPIDGNNQYGDCLYAAACHGDNTFTGNSGAESTFDPSTIVTDYLQLSGGDNGLNEGQIVGAWQNGLANTPSANILGSLNLDPTNAAAMQAAIYFFGGVLFMLDIPETWYQTFETGSIWDAPATADQNNGHGVWWNGVNTSGYYKLQTWGTYGWITPAGVGVCDPSCFVVFSKRWFNAQGVAPNGMTFDQLAALWEQFGGQPVTRWSLQQINLGGLTAGPAAVSDPASFVYNNQTHVLYRDAAGKVWDSWYDGGTAHWNLQQINLGGLTAGPAAMSDPASFVYNNQTHVLYRDAAGKIWDSWYDGQWNLQQINLGGVTTGPAAVGDPASFVYGNQTHVLYCDAAGEIWDSWYDGATSHWNLQKIDLGGDTSGPASVSNPASFIYNNQTHVLYRDAAGKIYDSWYDGGAGHWNLQQINLGGVTSGPAALSDPASFIYNNQSHVLYRDAAAKIWDSWYDGGTGQWNLQQINLGGLTGGPGAVGDPASFIYNNQSHVLYCDASGEVWDSWYDGGTGQWNLQEIDLGGVTSGPASAGNPASFIYNNQSHVLYRDGAGRVWDSWYQGT
jgi:hypothetical protein